MATLSIPKSLQGNAAFVGQGLDNEDVVKSLMNIYSHEVLPVIDKFYQAVVYNDYKLLPSLSMRLRPYFQTMGISTEALETMEHPEELQDDHRNIQKLYFKVRTLCESGIEIIRTKRARMETRNMGSPEKFFKDIDDLE